MLEIHRQTFELMVEKYPLAEMLILIALYAERRSHDEEISPKERRYYRTLEKRLRRPTRWAKATFL